MENNTNFKEDFKMLEIIVFAVALVVAQVTAGIIMMKLMLNKGFLKKYSKLVMEISNEIVEEMDE